MMDDLSADTIYDLASDKDQHEYLIQLLGANPSAVNTPNRNGDTILHLALLEGCSLEILEQILGFGADLSLIGQCSRNALHCAVEGSCSLQVVKAILGRNKGLIDGRDFGSRTPLLLAMCFRCSLEVLNAMVDAGADPYAKDKEQRTALHLAAGGSVDKAVLEKLIFLMDKNSLHARDNDNCIPLHYAREGYIIQYLLAAGSNPWAKNINENTPLRRYIKFMFPRDRNVEVYIRFMNRTEEEREALRSEDLGFGDTYLHLVAGHYKPLPQAMRLLLQAGCDPYRKNHSNLTPFNFIGIFKSSGNKKGELQEILRGRPSLAVTCDYDQRHSFSPVDVKTILKVVALQDESLGHQLLDKLWRHYGCYDEIWREIVSDLDLFKNHSVTVKRSLRETILQVYMRPDELQVKPWKADAETFYRESYNALGFQSEVKHFCREVTELKDSIVSAQLYNMVLECRLGGKTVSLNADTTRLVLDHLSTGDLRMMAIALWSEISQTRICLKSVSVNHLSY